MRYLTTPTLVAIASAELERVARSSQHNSQTTGLPGSPLLTQTGISVPYRDERESPSSARITYVNPEVIQSWCAQCEYDLIGLIVYCDDRLYRVNKTHVSSTIHQDLQSGRLIDITGIKDPVVVWSTGQMYKSGRLIQHNGQLLISMGDHISSVCSSDCESGLLKFIANLYVGSRVLADTDYCFAGQIIDHDCTLYACMRSHTPTTWKQEYWSRLHPQSVATPVDTPTEPTYTSAVPLSAHIAVALDTQGCLVPADCTMLSQYATVLGITEKAYPANRSVTVKSSGMIKNLNWRWTMGKPIYYSPEGRLTQDRSPEAKYSQVVAMPVSPTTLCVYIHPPVILYQR